MRRPDIHLPKWITPPVCAAFVALLIGIGLLVGALNTGHTDKKADSAKKESRTAKRRATAAVALSVGQRNKARDMVLCLLNTHKTNSERAKCLNLTLPAASRNLPGIAGRPGGRGPQGAPGVGRRGPRGPTGPRGPLGPKGNPCLASLDPLCVGPAGEPGKTGDPGEQGKQGDTGATGAKCDTGAAGAAGKTGDTGPQGPPGPAGGPGPAGPAGPQGAPGPQGPAVASFTFSFVDAAGVQQTRTCSDPDGDLNYTCQ
jgi:hypothetical protein